MLNMDISKILQEGERVTLECKKARNSVPNSLWETYSAFANTYGGIILLGVAEHSDERDFAKRFEIIGVEDAEKIRKDLWNIVNSKEKININVLCDNDVQIVNMDGKQIVAVVVPRVESNLRPVFINNNMSKGTFKRNHEGDYHCSEQELKMMLRDANESGNDKLILEHYTMDDIDIPTLENYRIMFQTNNPDHVWNGLDHKSFLMQLGGYAVNRSSGIEGLTLAGLMMFGKGLPIRERFDNIRMDYIDRSHLVGNQRYSDRLTYDGTWENNLYNFLRIVLSRLSRDLPRPFQMKGVIRNDDTLQHKAIREAVTNMIIHSDLLVNGILKIEKFEDRIVLTNPGLLKLPLIQIYAGGESKARNQRIQNMLRMIGYGENLGSGFPLILNAWSEQGWLRPELIEQTDLLQVRLTLFFENEPTSEPISKPISEPLSEREKAVLALIEQSPLSTRDELAESANMSLATLKRVLAGLREKGIIRRSGGNKRSRWLTSSNKCEPTSEPINEPISEREKAVLALIEQSPLSTRDELAESANMSLATLKRVLAGLREKGIIRRSGGNKRGQWLIIKSL